jgi:predicted nucleic acid-binding protein
VTICPPVEAELMVGIHADRDYEPFTAVLRRTFGWVPALDDPWRQVLAVQRDLVKIGYHRGPSPMDIIIALTAEAHGLTVAHVDADSDAVGRARGWRAGSWLSARSGSSSGAFVGGRRLGSAAGNGSLR